MLTVPLFAGGWYSVNIDLKTTAAMTAAYAAETATEMMNDEDVQKILDHYTNAEVSTAGIFASKWLDRKALQNAGLFGDAEENFYYKRIYTMVSAQIMPKILDVAALAVRNPEKAIYWGPYLFRTCEQVKQLCMTFETVVANGKVSFQDVAFLVINDNLKGLFDLTKLGEVDWAAVWDHLADFGDGLTKEDLEEDLEGLMTAGGAIVSGGGAVLDSVWTNASRVGGVFHSRPGEILQLYHDFKDMYETLSDPSNIKDLVMQQILSTDSTGVANLFTLDGYNITSYISDYLQEMQGRYYTQRWYIYWRDSGSEQVCSYAPPTDSESIMYGGEWYRVGTSDANYQYTAADYENSLRIYEVPLLPYMDRPADTREGCKHRCTNAAMEYFKSEVMEMCHREGLYQIDLLNGSKNRITDREYWAQKKGQAALDKQNAPMIADSITPRQTKFETNKEKLRQTLRKALATAASFDEFSSLLLQEGVTVKESRGRLSYLTPDRTKPITARKLGDDFDRAAVFAVLEQNAARAAEAPARSPDPPRTIKDRLQVARAEIAAPKQDGVQRLVDIEQKMAEGKGRGYERWAKIHNLKQAAKTLSVYQQYGFTSPEQLEAAVDTAYQKMRQTSGELKALETKLQGKKKLQRQVLAYAQTKAARDGLRAQKSEKARAAYRQAHESDFIIADAAARYFKAHGITKLPARKALQAEIEQLISEKDGLYNTYHEQKQRFKELQTVKRNIDQILRRDEPHRRKEQSHER